MSTRRRVRRRMVLTVSALLLPVVLTALFPALSTSAQTVRREQGAAVRRVVVIGISGISWRDLAERRHPGFARLIEGGSLGNVSVRVSNNASDAYVTLGAGRRAAAGAYGGLAFNSGESVAGTTAGEIFRRWSGADPGAGVVVLDAKEIARASRRDRFSAGPGLLAETLRKRGISTAVVGNADLSFTPPAQLPDLSQDRDGAGHPAVEVFHREAALAAMDRQGRVPAGDVGAATFAEDLSEPFGVATSAPALVRGFREAAGKARFIVVETGDSERADLFSSRLSPEERARIRYRALRRVDSELQALMGEVDLSRDLVIALAPTTPGGPARRGQLRPVMMAGPGFRGGVLDSPGTRRPGLITIEDVSATISQNLGASGERLGSGRAAHPSGRDDSPPKNRRVRFLEDMNEKAVTSDGLRTPFSTWLIAFDVAAFSLGVWHLWKGRLPAWMRTLLLTAITLPLASFISGSAAWRLGPRALTGAIVGVAFGLGALLAVVQGTKGVRGAAVVAGLGVAFFLADLAAGAPVQLDSVFGYTSVSGGRYYGLGNLGFAIFSSSAVLLSAFVAERKLPDRSAIWGAAAVLFVVLAGIGHPALGADVGGTLAMTLTSVVFVLALLGRRPFSRNNLLLLAATAAVAFAVFAVADVARGTARSHLGDFVEGLMRDPSDSWLILRRKALSAVTFGLLPWGLLVLPAVLVFSFLRRRMDLWQGLIARRPVFVPAFQALMVAGVAGSLLNDSGIVVGGMVLAFAVPWVLLEADETGGAQTRAPPRKDPGKEAADEVPTLPRPV